MSNNGKRDILIFPKFENIHLIQDIRSKFDPLANLVAPHITLAFPFSDDMSNEELIEKLNNLLVTYHPFKITFSGMSLSDAGYIFLNCINGFNDIVCLHDEIYQKILPTHFKSSVKYIPHITLGQSNNIEELRSFEYEFNTIVDEVSVELIGNCEESIIIKNIKFGGML